MRYYETFTMTKEEREILSLVFDNNMTLLGKTFKDRLEWVFDTDIYLLCVTLLDKLWDSHYAKLGSKVYSLRYESNEAKIPILIIE